MYPKTYMRENYNGRMYCEIAVKNYIEAKRCLNRVKILEDENDIYEEEEQFNHALSITIVFSSIAIESFINNYLATCLGDNEFYDDFDNLKTISKINMAAKFIIGKNIEKHTELYYCINELIKNRNKIVHSKSRSCHHKNYIDEEISYINYTIKEFFLKEIEKDFKIAKNSIKAMVLLSNFFDEYDKNADAKAHFFPLHINNYEEEYKNDVLKEFKI